MAFILACKISTVEHPSSKQLCASSIITMLNLINKAHSFIYRVLFNYSNRPYTTPIECSPNGENNTLLEQSLIPFGYLRFRYNRSPTVIITKDKKLNHKNS